MRRRKKKKKQHEKVEMKVTAMLDMAFQLLTFFILTFKTAPVEGQVQLRLPLPKPVTGVSAGATAGADDRNTDPLETVKTLTITVLGAPNGEIAGIAVGADAVGNPRALKTKLETLLGDEGFGFEQVIIQVGSDLHYENLMQIVDVCTQTKMPDGTPLTKLSFVELPN